MNSGAMDAKVAPEADGEAPRTAVHSLPLRFGGRRIATAAMMVTSITLFSRVLGLAREALIAGAFGAGPQTDAFFVAFKVPDIIFNSLMNFLVATCFVPLFTESLNIDGKGSASEVASSVMSILLVTLTALTGIMILFANQIIAVLAPGLVPETIPITVRLMRIMSPIIILGGLTGLGKSILNTFSQYAIPALVPVSYNVVMMSFILLFGKTLGVESMAWGLLVSAVCQVAILLPSLRRLGLHIRIRVPSFDRRVRMIGKLAGPVLLGMILGNLHAFVETYLASGLGQGAISYLSYAYRIFTVPEQIYTIVVSTILFPLFAADVARKDWVGLSAKLVRGLSFTVFSVLPASILIVCGNREIVGLMLGRGAFDSAAVEKTAIGLGAFGVGLAAVCARSLLTFVFFALQDTKFLLTLTTIMIPTQLAIDLVLIRYISFSGLALGNSIAALIHVGLLLIALRSRIDCIDFRGIARSFSKVGACAAVMFAAAGIFRWTLSTWTVVPSPTQQITTLLGLLVCASTVYLLTAWFVRVQEMRIVWARVLNQVRPVA